MLTKVARAAEARAVVPAAQVEALAAVQVVETERLAGPS
jgi:hypothetical protein